METLKKQKERLTISSHPLLIACDFDGTITRQDTLVEILDKYGSSQWREVQKKVVSGELSIREGLQMEMGSVRATEKQLKELLMDRVEVEPSFISFLQTMRANGIPVIVLTGGFDLCVESVLAKAGLWPLPYLSNRLYWSATVGPGTRGAGWQVEFPYSSLNCPACGHCKGDPIATWNSQGYTTVFIGNGVTDRCGAQTAKLTFAKGELAQWCEAQKIAAVSFQTFHDIQKELLKREWL